MPRLWAHHRLWSHYVRRSMLHWMSTASSSIRMSLDALPSCCCDCLLSAALVSNAPIISSPRSSLVTCPSSHFSLMLWRIQVRQFNLCRLASEWWVAESVTGSRMPALLICGLFCLVSVLYRISTIISGWKIFVTKELTVWLILNVIDGIGSCTNSVLYLSTVFLVIMHPVAVLVDFFVGIWYCICDFFFAFLHWQSVHVRSDQWLSY